VRIIFLIIVMAFCALVATFAFQNLQSVTVIFLGLQLTAPLAILIALVYVFGMATGGGLFSFLRYSLHKATSPQVRASAPTVKVIDHNP
jgi:uncharacterized integral membrane protein